MNRQQAAPLLVVERHGADAIPRAERTKTWADLFVINTGSIIATSTLLVGGLLVPALSWADVLIVLVVGNVILGALIALMGYMGVDHGIPAAVMSRFVLGHPTGARLCSILLLLSLVGWFAVQAELGGLAVDSITSDVFGFSAPRTMILLLAAMNVVVAIVGFESIKWLSRLSVPLLMAVMVWLTVTILSNHPLADLLRYDATGEISIATGIDWMIGGAIVAVFIASDISRYIRSRSDNWTGTMLGVVPAAVFLTALGALSSLATGDWNPVNGVRALGLGAPALFVIVFATWTTNDLNLYSGGLALTNALPSVRRWQNTLLLGAAGTGLAVLRITEHFTTFLELLTNVFGPLVGVALADYFVVRRTRLDVDADATVLPADGWHWRGLNLAAWTASAAGIIAAFATPAYMLASLVSIGVSACVYYLLVVLTRRGRRVSAADAEVVRSGSLPLYSHPSGRCSSTRNSSGPRPLAHLLYLYFL